MTIDRELWLRARSLFDELVELAPDARRARLSAVSGSDAALGAAVTRLLDADGNAEQALREYRFGPAEIAERGESGSEDAQDPLGIVGKTVSHFVVTGYLAAGGMGVVYTAEDLQLGRSVALKFPLPHQRMDPSVKGRFMQEARSAAALDHPNLCTVYEVGESAQGVFLAMPLYPGETLEARLARERVLAPEQAIAILQQVLAGLGAAHAAGIIHRDLKPGNIMLLPDGAVRIVDFGLAKARDVNQTGSRATLGTIAYMAPEQIRHGVMDPRTDLWAIGAMLHEMLTGSAPFRGDYEMSVLHAVLHDDPPNPSELSRALPRCFDIIVAGLLQKDPAHRYPSVEALRMDLDAASHGAPVRHRVPFWNRTVHRRRMRRTALPVTIAVVGLATVGVLASFATDRGRVVTTRRPAALRFVGDTAVISSADELLLAMTPANAGRTIHLRAGTYDIRQPITIPDGMTLEGEGVMLFDASGHPMGFRTGTRTVLRMTARVGGEVLTLGDRVTVRNVEIDDLEDRSGNVIGVFSRRPHDHVTATIIETIISNPNPQSVAGGGQLGATLRILTENPRLGADPPPHDSSTITVRVWRSIFRVTAGGVGWFAFNFASNSTVSLELSHNVLGGENIANGGVSRPDAVHDSDVRISSDHNIYRNEWDQPCASPLTAWNLTGGSGSPVPLPRLAAAVRNTLRLRSIDDRMERFTRGIWATGSRRFFGDALNAAPSGNRIDLQLSGTVLAAASCPATTRVADLDLAGAASLSRGLYPGDSNTVRVELHGVAGSGTRFNRYDDSRDDTNGGSPDRHVKGSANRLVIAGDVESFRREVRGIDPVPDARFFMERRSTGVPRPPRE